MKKCWKIMADDYHEFELAQAYYRAAGLKTRFVEMDSLESIYYVAVFWISPKTPEVEAKIKQVNHATR